MSHAYQALVVRKGADKTFAATVETLNTDALPAGDVLIRVRFSAINYKDSLSAQGNPAITRRFPHTPGIDAAGEIVESLDPAFVPGQGVMVISRAMGMSLPGGFGQYVRVPAAWVWPLPDGLNARDAMALGTPALTAALAVEALLDAGLSPGAAEVAVTGASGGVGCLAVALLAAQGFAVSAISGKPDAQDFLRAIGAAEIVPRAEVEDDSGRNLLPTRWDGAVDVAGGALLSGLIRRLRDGGAVAATGMVQATAFDANVLPFILRGVRLIGINAESTRPEHMDALWRKLAGPWKPALLERTYTLIGLDDLPAALDRVAQGRQTGRIVVDLGPDTGHPLK